MRFDVVDVDGVGPVGEGIDDVVDGLLFEMNLILPVIGSRSTKALTALLHKTSTKREFS